MWNTIIHYSMTGVFKDVTSDSCLKFVQTTFASACPVREGFTWIRSRAICRLLTQWVTNSMTRWSRTQWFISEWFRRASIDSAREQFVDFSLKIPHAGRRTDFWDKNSSNFSGEIFWERNFGRSITAPTTLFPLIGCGVDSFSPN